jgi:hypothetical protein
MKRHLIVFEYDDGRTVDLRRFVDSLDDGAQAYSYEGHFCLLRTNYSASDISERLHALDSRLNFFVADITKSEASGQMFGRFWDFIKEKPPALQDAAE